MRLFSLTVLLILLFSNSVFSQVKTGAENTEQYFPLLKDKRLAIVANRTSVVGRSHLIDTLSKMGFDIKIIFAPEHGFRGNIGAGDHVADTIDQITGLKIVSLYGKRYIPRDTDIQNVDVVIFDIQDVGVRCYTYLSTLHYIMDASAKFNKQLIVLDRPNPNGFYIAGPVLDLKYKSFVGLHPVPLVYGMTIGEYALMINGERWLNDSAQCRLIVVPCVNYQHSVRYHLPIAPSPNLKTMGAVYHYPSLVLFEGTVVNVGRGTDFPFEVYGHPCYNEGNIQYTPQNTLGAINPPHVNLLCNGKDLRGDTSQFTLKYIIDAYHNISCEKVFFNSFFRNLIGTNLLQQQIINKLDEIEIFQTWEKDLDTFKLKRKKYLIYKDF